MRQNAAFFCYVMALSSALLWGCSVATKTKEAPGLPPETCGGLRLGETVASVCAGGGQQIQSCQAGGELKTIVACVDEEPSTPGDCADTSVTFADVKPLIERTCLGAGCHGNFAEYGVAKGKIDAFISRTSLNPEDDRRMPRVPREAFDAAQKKLLVDWKAAGLKERPDCGAGPAAPERDYFEFQDAEAAIDDDADRISDDGEEEEEFRWLVCTHLLNVGSGEEFEACKQAAVKAVNSLSTERDLYTLPEVAPGVFRVELEEFGLDAADWTLIENADLLDVESNTSRGQELKARTGARKPWMYVDSFIDAAFRSSATYYAILGVELTFAAQAQELGVDYAGDIADLEAIFAGTSKSPLSSSPRLVAFHESEDGFLSTTYDTGKIDEDEESLTRFPLLPDAGGQRNFRFQAGEAIFTLPNGLHGYMLANSTVQENNGVFVRADLDQRADAAPTDVVRDWLNPAGDVATIRAAMSCFRCHANGYWAVTDEIRAAAAGISGSQLGADKDLALALYRGQAEVDAVIAEENARYQAALEEIGVSLAGKEPITVMADRYLTPWTLEKLAGVLWLSPADTEDCIRSSAIGLEAFGPMLTGSSVAFDEVDRAIDELIDNCRRFEDPL